MNIRKLLFCALLINVFACKDTARKATLTLSETYNARFNNLKKIPEVQNFFKAHARCEIILLQNEGCTPCNEEKLFSLKDSLLRISADRLVVISSGRPDSSDQVYKLFKDDFNVIKIDSEHMMRLGLCLRQYYIIKFENFKLVNWRIYDRR